MDKKVTGIVCYITWIGWLIAYLAGDKEGAKFHLNQGLVLVILNIAALVLSFIPIVKYISGIINIVVFIFMLVGIVYAAQGQDKELPLIGGIKILK